MEFHDVCKLFPMMADDEYRALVEDIRQNGLREPIVVWQGKIIDGRNRYYACMELGITPQYREWDGRGSLVSFVVSQNLHRRHLSASQKAVVALEIERMLAVEAEERRVELGRQAAILQHDVNVPEGSPNFGRTLGNKDTEMPSKSGETWAARQAAGLVGVAHGYVSEMKRVERDAPELVSLVRAGVITVPEAKLLARLDAEERMRVVRVVEEGEAEDVRDAISRIRKQERIAELERQREAIESGRVAVPVGLFDVIVVDPPWPYGTEYDPYTRRAASPYPEMSLEEIREIRLPAKEDCVLWLWTTHLFMRHAFAILDAWGFREVAILTWVKDRLGLGSWLRSKSEFCIMAVKGKPVVNLTNQSTVLFAPMREHSRKPDEFYEMVETLCPGRKLDFFSREPRPGWEQFGNDVERFK